MKSIIIPLITAAVLLSSCTSEQTLRRAAATITAEELREYTRILGSDSFLGRKPFTEGETITVNYLAAELEKIGFAPLFGDSYFQEVPMVEITTTVVKETVITAGGRRVELSAPDDIALKSPTMTPEEILQDIPMVFCGFGIVAPEYGWNDYAGVDVRDKCAIVLVNDPGLYSGDPKLFKGREMTYYGRWTYKFEEAARQGAAAVLIIHETLGAGYDYSIQRKSSLSPSLYMEPSDDSPGTCRVTGWLNDTAAETLFEALGLKVDELREKATVRGYKGFDMESSISIQLSKTFIRNSSVNVAGILYGKRKPEECVVISAHWDHFGVGEAESGDSIYNGAVDNGTSIAWALETGEALASIKRGADRSEILFFPTAEEQGLLGSTWFTANPPVRAEKMIACFNNDLMLPIGRMRDIMITGYGQSELDDLMAEAARRQERYLLPDPNAETGMYFRSDHFPFANIGVPALYARGNCDSREFGVEWAAAEEQDYLLNKYHKPADNYSPEMNFEGIAEDARATLEVVYRIVNSDIRPAWKSGSEFANIRSTDL